MEQFKRAKVVLLPTKNQSNIFLKKDNKLEFNINSPLHGIKDLGWKYQHLYIISDDETKKGDLIITDKDEIILIENEELWHIGNSKKIIATTDTSLEVMLPHDVLIGSQLSQPSNQFIFKYIEEYNKGNVITDVLIEYENNRTNNPQYPHKSNREFDDNWQLKIDKNNTITIKKLKDSWNREEVSNLIHKFMIDCDKKGVISSVEFIDWIENNL